MNNQRPGKVVRAIDPTMKDMSMLKFFKLARKVLEDEGKEDEAFYFEQIKDYLKDGGELDPKMAARALGL